MLLFPLLFCYTWVLSHFVCCCTLYSCDILGYLAILFVVVLFTLLLYLGAQPFCLLLYSLLLCYTWALGHFVCGCTLYSFAILGCSAILSTWYLNESKWTVSELTLSEPDLYIFRPIWVLLLSLVEAFFVTLLWTPCGIWTIPHYGLWADACFGWSSKFLLSIESTPIQLVAWNNPFKLRLYMMKPWQAW